MRILFVAAGAAGMYCGSCLRDNALAAELKARGHDVLLVPLYTPLLTDEPNVSEERVFFGGISVYLQQHAAIFRKVPSLVDKLLDAPWLIRAASSGSISTDPRSLGELTISMLKGEEGFQRREFDKLMDWLTSEAPPDVIQLPNALLASLAKPLKRELKRPVHCTLQGEDLFLDGLEKAHREAALDLIRRNATFVDRFTAVSDYYATFMATYLSIPPDKIDVVPLGINLTGFPPRRDVSDGAAKAASYTTSGAKAAPDTTSAAKAAPDATSAADAAPDGATRPFTVGYLARIAPEKGLRELCDAYVHFRRSPGVGSAQLEVAGYMASDQQHYLKAAERRLADAGFGGEFRYRGFLDRDQKISFLRNLDVFSVPTTYVEPKGLFLLEAMACGVPVVQPRHGAFPEMIAKTLGGLLVEPGDAPSLADGLRRLWEDPKLRADLGQRGFDGVRRHYSIGQSADRMLKVYEGSMC